MTNKKVVNVDTTENREKAQNTNVPEFKPSEENKAKAGKFRLFASIAWVLAILGEIGAIYLLSKPPINTVVLIVLVVAIMLLAILGSQLWKKANRLDPASKKDKVRFFIQNQLGVIITAIAFIPLIVLIFLNKDMDKKQKGLVGGIAVVALVIAGYFGIDFNAPSIEEYTEQAQEVVDLTGQDYVYWTTSGTRYHLYSDCSYINTSATTEIFEGTVAQSRALKNITELCSRCRDRWQDENPSSETGYHDHDHEVELAALVNLLP
ncbi:MAG: hypothetical protein ACK5LZ_05230 [Anaerorhabdus sp.]